MWHLARYTTLVGIVVCFGRQLDASHDVRDDANTKTAFDHNPVCPIGCVTCSAYNGCVTCQRSYFLFLQWHGMRQTGSCVDRCPKGYFGKKKRGHGKCLKCSLAGCESCSNRTTCTSCDRPLYLYDGQCIDKCPEHLPYAGHSRKCKEKVDCEVSPWRFWSVCNLKGFTCGYKYGLQTRSRQVTQMPSENGLQCPVTVQFRKCRMKHRHCEDTDTNESDLTKVVKVNEVNWKRLERILLKHEKRKQKNKNKKNKNKKKKQDRAKNEEDIDILQEQTMSPT